VSSVCTWFYVDAQMMHRLNGFVVAWLSHVVSSELRPTVILQCFSTQVVERAAFTLYVCTAVVPRSTTCSIFIVQCECLLQFTLAKEGMFICSSVASRTALCVTQLCARIDLVTVRYRKSRYCHAMYKLLYPSIRVRTGQRLLYRLGSGLGLVLVLVLRFCMCPADLCDSGHESLFLLRRRVCRFSQRSGDMLKFVRRSEP